MIHIVLHFMLPLLVALVCYSQRWRIAALIMIATMVVDADHLLADPIYDPDRCSIGFHPLHTVTAIAFYVALTVLPLVMSRTARSGGLNGVAWPLHLIGVGLLVHMALDWIDCRV